MSAVLARALGLSPLSTMPNGYGGVRRRLDEMDDVWNWRVLHDEMKRRNLALFFSHPGTVRTGHDSNGLPILTTPMGNGSSGRSSGATAVANFWSRNSRTYLAGRPSRMTPEGRAWLKPGMAPIAYPGSSVHEDDTWESRCLATDCVGWEDGWAGPNVARFALRTFWNIGNEPWHLQPAGYGASKSDLKRDLGNWGLGTPPLPPVPLAAPIRPPTSPTRVEAEDDMLFFETEPDRVYESRGSAEGPIKPGEVREIDLRRMTHVFGGVIGAIRNKGHGYLTVGGTHEAALAGKTAVTTFDADGRAEGYAICGVPTGRLYVAAFEGPCDVTVDISMWGAGRVA